MFFNNKKINVFENTETTILYDQINTVFISY